MLIDLKNSDKKAIIDDEDFNLVKGFSWLIQSDGYAISYLYHHKSSKVKCSVVFMHRLILNVKKGDITDHINHNGMDNRKENLRACTHTENMANRKVSKASKTGIKGVYFEQRGVYKRFVAEIRSNGVRTKKSFKTLDEANIWRQETAKILHGEFYYP